MWLGSCDEGARLRWREMLSWWSCWMRLAASVKGVVTAEYAEGRPRARSGAAVLPLTQTSTARSLALSTTKPATAETSLTPPSKQ